MSGPELAGYAVMERGRVVDFYINPLGQPLPPARAGEKFEPVYLLPNGAWPVTASWGLRIRWFLAGAVVDGALGALLHIVGAAL